MSYKQIIDSVRALYPSLQKLPEEFDNRIESLILASRKGVKSCAAGMSVDTSLDLLHSLGKKVVDFSKKASLDEDLARVIIDLDSLESVDKIWRIYIFTVDVGDDSKLFERFPLNVDISSYDNMVCLGVGFYYDSQNDKITHYKHYYFQSLPSGLFKYYNFRHLEDGTYLNLITEKGGINLEQAKADINIQNTFSEELTLLDGIIDNAGFSTRADQQYYLIPKSIITNGEGISVEEDDDEVISPEPEPLTEPYYSDEE